MADTIHRSSLRALLRACCVLLVFASLLATGCAMRPTFDKPAARDEVMSRMRERTDEAARVRWLHHASSAYRRIGSSAFELCIKQPLDTPGSATLWLRTRWSGSEWAFFHGMTITADGVRHDINTTFSREVNNVVGYIVVTEWSDTLIVGNELDIVRSVIDSDHAVLRMRGERGYRDYTFKDADRVMLTDVLTAFEVIKAQEKQSKSK